LFLKSGGEAPAGTATGCFLGKVLRDFAVSCSEVFLGDSLPAAKGGSTDANDSPIASSGSLPCYFEKILLSLRELKLFLLLLL
jgi:hypothetical protein